MSIILDGKNLTFKNIIDVARNNNIVDIDNNSFIEIENSRKIVFELMDSNKQIYGLTTGLGANKDNKITPNMFENFNKRIIKSHQIALPPFANEETVRATLLIRLNGLLNGLSGIQPEIVARFKEMLNLKIHPLIPERGSVGMSDLGNMAYIGASIIGDGKVIYKNEIVNSKVAFEKEGLKPIKLGPKDGLALVSTNAFSVAKAALLYIDIKDLLLMADTTFALGFEALGFNKMFIDERAYVKRPLKGQIDTQKIISNILEGSELFYQNNDSIGGTLSYKSSCAIHGAIRDSLYYIEDYLPNYINSSDDCPIVLTKEKEIISTDNFIVTGLAVAFEMMGISLAHLSKLISNRILRLNNESFTGLPRFLRPDKNIIAYSTVQKTISALDSENRLYANPVSIDYLPTANETEDHGCNTPLVMIKTEKIVDNLYYLLAIELIESAQAYDLGKKHELGKGTKFAYDKLRNIIPFLEDDDRDIGDDIQKVYKLLKNKEILIGMSC